MTVSKNVNTLYTDLLYKLRFAPIVNTRNGRAKALQEPIIFGSMNPTQRVLFNPLRKANPYLHVMETVWMFAGSKKVEWLAQFSKQMLNYADDGEINGAYGHRWRLHFNKDQIMWVIKELQRDGDSRQAVIAMYDPTVDQQAHWKDRPCNTHIYFRRVNNKLDMTVCNRSNDVVWGACGANAVHMTYLQELVARSLKWGVGNYYVMSNNLHIYEPHWPLLESPAPFDFYAESPINQTVYPYPLFGPNESDPWEFLNECEQFVANDSEGYYKSGWLNDVALPMYEHYVCRLNGDKDTYDMQETKATDWRLAEQLWKEWHSDY